MKKLFLLFFLIASCGRPPAPPPDTLRISFSVYPATWDPRKSGDFVSSTMVCLLYEGLTRCLPDGGVEPGIAERVEVSTDQKLYTFHLREAFWSDGAPVTAHDFERSWKQACDPAFPSLCAYLFYPILNAEAARMGQKSSNEIGVRALDDQTLQVALERPTPYFLSLTAFPSFLPAHPDEENIGNGPYCIERVVPQAEIDLRKSPMFWNRDQIHLERIQISIVPDENTALQMFERGELDWLGGALSPLPTDAFPSLEGKIQYFPMAASTFCTFNTTSGPFQNEHFRKAFSLAIDRIEIAEKILPAHQTPAVRCIPPALLGGENRSIISPFNPELAREELRKGLEEAELGPITLCFRSGGIDRTLAQAIQRQWKEVLGIEVTLRQTDFKTHKELLHQRHYQVALASWISQHNDLINILERFKSAANAKNYPGWEDDRFRALIEAAENSPSNVERTALLAQAEERLLDSMPIAPIYHWSNPTLCSPRVKNMHTTPSGGVLFEKCWLSPIQINH
ncbi:MAG: peptide ABC transporter substrate-binding protein [Verrucomicrobiota bacterium]|nr:peptide ABC transporter substrate-binding protein [Verrucomicrobiota bacterium]